MNRERARKDAANKAYANRFPARSQAKRKAARKARSIEREARWIAAYDQLEHAAGHQGINPPPAPKPAGKRRKKHSKIGAETRRRSPHRRGRPRSDNGSRPAALSPAETRTEALTCV